MNNKTLEDDDQEGPSAGSNRGSKRQKEGGEHASASTPSEIATEGAGRTTTESQSRQLSATAQRDAQSWINDLARQTDARSSFNELLDTPIDFSNFIMHRLNVDTVTPDLLAGPTYELMRGSCTSLTELEYHLEEVYKATTDQLDWVNPEDFSNFIMHRLNVDTVTPDLLAGPTYELMRGSCTSLTELEYHLEEVYKATT
nr:hypothetical protein [Tanacetum cinerariifolium]